ncbi:proline racemase/trans-L-3-hydroxyproline dehydratase [Streptosporangium album]|uniref:Proline racemase/trans-L-3-hydroxyproline dehydratase n=1 Tax=Streptosporangium album TaxID=47479 RepID=A0A7W7WDD1_9ACTN|nr:proline racemase family protein [Streptosporangium album]MBB4942209.1 proline racemase/trans-L-3-hydroxyproline dehydratase [Streptosporangium album]
MGREEMIHAIDYHTGGEPFRIVTAGVPGIPGATVLERRESARAPEIDGVRRLLCHEPRGHADMYGCFLVPPDDAGADLGVLFWHKDGYSTACGHGTIALGVYAVDSGLVEADPDGETDVVVDVPSGRVTARVRCSAGLVEAVTFRNVPSYVLAREVELGPLSSAGTAQAGTGPGVPAGTDPSSAVIGPGRLAGVRADISYGGAIYASVPAAAFGLSVVPEHLTELIALGRAVKAALGGHPASRHPEDDRLSGIYGVIFYDDLGPGRQRNVTVFADGEVDRSPCGSGTAARLALLHADGFTGVLTHDGIVGTSFRARVAGITERGIVPEVEGMAYRTGDHRFTLDPRDPVGTGFTLR